NGQNESLTTIKASPAISTSASEVGNVVGSAVLSDTATLSGGFRAEAHTSALTSRVTPPYSITPDTKDVTVTGDGTYGTSNVIVATQVGTYTWHASYTRSLHDALPIYNGQNESLTTIKASPAISTSASEVGNVVGSAVLSDTATLSGGF